MRFKMNFRTLLGVVTLLMAGMLPAQAATGMESCQDARGQPIPVAVDYQQTVLVRSVVTANASEIRYNPLVAPALSDSVRMFFYAAQCARHGMGEREVMTLARARVADCAGLNALLDGGLLQRDALPGLKAETGALTDADWEVLPGPPRAIDIAHCPINPRGVFRLPASSEPSPAQSQWNDCVRSCGDRLWHCQKQCRGSDCDQCMISLKDCEMRCKNPVNR